MANSLFAALPGIFTQVLGEDQAIVYTPISVAGTITLPPGSAIFEQNPELIVLGTDGPTHDGQKSVLHVQGALVPNPAEGDTALIAGVTWRVVPPIQPDGKGMILLTLEAAS